MFKKIGNAFVFVWTHNRVFVIVSACVIAFLLALSLVITQVTLINNTFNTTFGEDRRVLKSGDPSTAQYFTKSEGIKNKQGALSAANALNEKICQEGFVLLKNEDSLPLASEAKISVFGINSIDIVYGGSGSSAKKNTDGVDLYKSLINANISYNPTLKNFYDNKKAEGKGRTSQLGFDTGVLKGLETGELALNEYEGGVMNYVNEYSDAALVVFSRIGGEGYDLPRTMQGIAGANSEDHYLQLDNNERALLTALCAADSAFDNVVVIINSATPMELGFLEDGSYGEKLKGAIWMGTTGGTGLNALGRILNGEVSPSGRTVDTYARNFDSAPSWKNFSDNMVNDGNRYQVDCVDQNAYFVDYEEGIYVGYRYYETRGYTEYVKSGNYSWYDEEVVYPFGYGLSYADFEWNLLSIKIGDQVLENGDVFTEAIRDKKITVEVNVKNISEKFSGKEVVELYFSAPYAEGEVEKSHVVLGAFAKTEILKPNADQNVTISFNVRDMASYDYADLNGNNYKTWEADAGDYTIYIGKNANDAWRKDGTTFTLSDDIIYNFDPYGENETVNRFDDVSSHIETYLSRDDWNGTFPTTPSIEDRNVSSELIDSMSTDAYIGAGSDVDEGKKWYRERRPRQARASMSYSDTKIKMHDMIDKDYDDKSWETLLSQLTVKEMRYLVGTGNFNTAIIDSIGKPKTIDPDGPAGFTTFMSVIESTQVVYDTCFYASECVIGATWNVELAEAMGKAIGDESLVGNERGDGRTYSGWYAPAVNIHRSPFSGRNWEYYSEDGFLSGKMAAHVICGAKSKGVYTYVKHFAINDQETNRDTNGLITWLNEQSMREIYLKPFELAVKEGKTTAMMTSFNRIGTVWAGGSYELLTEVLREEWGFKGMVITDYANSYMDPDQMIRAGGDLSLFQDQQPSASGLRVNASHLTALRNAVKNILYTVSKSNAMNGMGPGIEYVYAMAYWKIVLIIIDCAIVTGIAVWGFFAIRSALKKAKADKYETESLK